MSQVYASGKYAKSICDICGFEYPLSDLKPVSLSAYGTPSNAPSGNKACPKCWDEPHPQSFLSVEVQKHGADPQQIRGPRPDIFPIAYPVSYRLPSSLFKNGSTPLSLARGFSGRVNAASIYAGTKATVPAPPAGITVNSVTWVSPQLVVLNITVSGGAATGTVTMAVNDGSGRALNGQITIT